jgi:hypothetical protein
MRVPLATLVVACLALAGCGSTVPVGSQGVLGADGQGLDTTGQTGQLGGTTPRTLTGGGPTGSEATGTIARTPGQSATGTGPGSVPSAGTIPQASTSRAPAQVGIMLYPDVAQFAAALGGTAGDVGNQEAVTRASAAWVNANGGLGGRKVELVIHNVELTSTDTYAQMQQEACTDFGQDHKAIAVLTAASSIDNTFPRCLAKYGIINIAGGHYLHDDTDFRTVRNLVAPSEASVSRLGKAMVAELTGRGLLKRGDTLGMLTEDAPAGLRTTNEVIIPLLKAQGIDVVNYVIHGPESTAAISEAAAAIQSAQLRMAAAGVKNVAFMCKGCHSLFVNYAESQQYYPRYFLHSIDGLRGVAGKGKTRTYAGAVALSWEPLADIGGYSHAADFLPNPSRALCKRITKGLVTDDTSEFIAQSICGGFVDLKAAADALKGAPITGANLMAGFDTFGRAHASAVNFGTEITSSKHYGAAGYRRMHFDAAKDAFVYDDRVLRPFPS